MNDTELLFTGEDLNNWFYEKFYYAGSNARYYTFQIALNLLHQRCANPVIIETGCQRQEDDLGGGMSTCLFAEYIERYGGRLISIDNNAEHLSRAAQYIKKHPGANVQLIHADSVAYLQCCVTPPNLLYLDSWDAPYFEMLELYGSKQDFTGAVAQMKALGRKEILERHEAMLLPCQQHCVNEFKAIETYLLSGSILLIDDNMLLGGGKSRLLKEYLLSHPDWELVLDYQQSLWLRK